MRALKSKFQTLLMQRSLKALAARFAGKDGIAVSVLCQSCNHASYLDLSLASLKGQLLPAQNFEVIVADNASSDATSDVLSRHRQKQDFALEILRFERQQSSGFLWNQLFEAARGEILVLWDDAMLAFPDLLMRHLMAHLEGDILVCGGSCPLVHSHLINSGEEICLQKEHQALAEAEDDWREVLRPFVHSDQNEQNMGINSKPDWIDFDSTHASLNRQMLHENGGFVEGAGRHDLGEWGLLSREFALRASRNGVELRYFGQPCTWRQIHSPEYIDANEANRHLNRFLAAHTELEGFSTEVKLRERLLPSIESAWAA